MIPVSSHDRQRCLLQVRKLLVIALSFVRRKPFRAVLFIVLVSILVPVVKVLLRTRYYFGEGKGLEGGAYGRRFDNSVKRALFHWTVYQHRKEFQQVTGYALPETCESSANDLGAPVLTQTWLAESVLRATARQKVQEQAAADAVREQEPKNNLPCQHPMQGQQQQQPRLNMLLPNVGNWYRPLGTLLLNRTRTVVFDETEIEHWMQTHFDWLFDDFFFQDQLSQSQRVQLWGVCAVYRMGGIFVSFRTSVPELDDLVSSMSSLNCSSSTGTGTGTSTAQLWFQAEADDDNSGSDESTSNLNSDIHYLAATPRHWHLNCVLQELQFRIQKSREQREQPAPTWSEILRLLDQSSWNQQDVLCAPRCCPASPSIRHQAGIFLEPFRIVNVAKPRDDPAVVSIPGSRFTVQVNEAAGTQPPAPSTKEPWSMRLQTMNCFAGWFCSRCLRLPWLGSFASCRSLCNSCHEEHICGEPSHTQQEVVVEVSVREQTQYSGEKRIPRIIHQTWFEELTPDRYPHLQRLQNSWKASGWDYRFYTDATARVYIQEHYPDRFVEAYDAILPGAFKADLFRLCVLLKEGGIYADIDVQLDVNLDSFLTNNLSFFVPRDVAIDHWPRANYCLWNGLLGAAPGHPIIARAVEDLMNRILNRQDYYDMEGSVCRQNPEAEIWKLRSFPILLVTGPCALGISVNGAFGRGNLVQGFDLGWLPEGTFSSAENNGTLSDSSWGDALILSTDRFDMGELRFTDINRNLLIASTNQDLFAKTPLSQSESEQIEIPAHYSQSNTKSDIVGEFGTYKDDQVVNERIRLQVIHTFV
jgi:hypothetical protein